MPKAPLHPSFHFKMRSLTNHSTNQPTARCPWPGRFLLSLPQPAAQEFKPGLAVAGDLPQRHAPQP